MSIFTFEPWLAIQKPELGTYFQQLRHTDPVAGNPDLYYDTSFDSGPSPQ
jgi:hypothetical protein